MAQTRIFVGREKELDRFDKFLRDPQGQALLVIGQQGMGKTVLLDQMLLAAREHPDLKCTAVRYEVTPTDSVDVTLGQIMDEPFTVSLGDKVLGEEKRRNKQLKALAGVFPMGENITALFASLQRNPNRNTRDQFLASMQSLSDRLPEKSRIVFAIDPEKEMQEKSDQSWAVVIPKLPSGIKFIFAQRPDDALATSSIFMTLPNVSSVTSDEGLDALSEKDIDKMLNQRASEVGHTVDVLRDAVAPYKGHPYAVPAALDLIQDGMSPEDLPPDPTPQAVAATQWNRICQTHEKAIPLFQAYAILEVPVPDKVVAAVSGVDNATGTYLLAQPFLGGLLRIEGEGRRIYHSLLSDHILTKIRDKRDKEETAFHQRAVEIYRKRLNADTKPDALAARRLPRHVKEAEGDAAFMTSFVNECFRALYALGQFEEIASMSIEILGSVKEGEEGYVAVRGNLGIVLRTLGNLDLALTIFQENLEIDKRRGNERGVASALGNLGTIYLTRGDPVMAEETFMKSLEITWELGDIEGLTSDYGSLANVYATRGNFVEAKKLYELCLAICDQSEDLKGMADMHSSLGMIYLKQDDYEESEGSYVRALNLYKKLGNRLGMAKEYGNLAIIYAHNGDDERAIEVSEVSLKINEELGRAEGIAANYSTIANLFLKMGEFTMAKQTCEKALELNTALGRQSGIAINCTNLGLIAEEEKDIEKARQYFARALTIFRRIGASHETKRVQDFLDGLDENLESGEEES